MNKEVQLEAPIEPSESAANERPFYSPGWYRDISNEDYHGSFGTSSSQLKKLMEKTPAHYLYDLTHPKEPTTNMQVGTAVHALVLEPDKFNDEFAILPDLNLRTKDGREAKASFEIMNAGKSLITAQQLIQATDMAGAVLDHTIASILLSDAITESSIYWWYKSMDDDDNTQYKEMLKVRPDAIGLAHPVIIDLKTTTDASYSGFIKSIQNYYYHLSAAMYLEGVNQCRQILEETKHYAFTKFIFICVENTPPYLVGVYELSPEYLEIGRLLFKRALRILHESREQGFPGFPEEVRVIDPPGWARRGFIV